MAAILIAIFTTSCGLSQPYQAVTEIDQLVGAGARLPRLVNLPNDEVLMSWVEPIGKITAFKYVKFKNGHVVNQGEVARGADWFLNWADFPSVMPITDSFWLSHRLVKQSGGSAYDYDVVLALSNDAGKTWRDIGKPHHDDTAAEHGFAAIFPVNGDAGIIWLDGRNYVEKTHDKNPPVEKGNHATHTEKSGNFQLRYTAIKPDGSMQAEQVLDENTCTCCWPSVTVTSDGPVAAWRGRTDDEIRDNQVAVLRDGKWSNHQPLGGENWKIDGCPVNGPALSARGMKVAAAWFSAAGDKPQVLMAFSTDGGLTFSKAITIDRANPFGRISLIWQDDNTAIVSWVAANDQDHKSASLSLRSVKLNSEMGEIKRIVQIGVGRDTGVPQMAYTQQGILLAWTNAESTHGIQTLLVPWKDLSEQHLIQKISNVWHTQFATKSAVFLASICGRPH